jgi:two-component sensor histidine kinase
MNLLPRTFDRPVRDKPLGYALGAALFLAGLATRAMANHWLPPGFPYLTFFPAVIVATFIAGRGPGILCAALSGLAAWYWYIPPYNGFWINGQIVTALLFYAFVVTVDIWLIHGLQRRQEKLAASQLRLEQMAEHQTLLFMELQHRVANNLASIASMLRLQRRQIERDPQSALGLIDRADERIELMGRIHRQLYDPAALDRPVSEQIAQAVRQAQDVIDAPGVATEIEIADIRLELSRLMTLILLITELLTNSVKHAFGDGGGTVRIVIERCGEGEICLTVSDNGRGFDPQQVADRPRRGLGTAIITGFVAQLRATMETRIEDGVTTAIRFPEH